jgi:hypothetical protein
MKHCATAATGSGCSVTIRARAAPRVLDGVSRLVVLAVHRAAALDVLVGELHRCLEPVDHLADYVSTVGAGS